MLVVKFENFVPQGPLNINIHINGLKASSFSQSQNRRCFLSPVCLLFFGLILLNKLNNDIFGNFLSFSNKEFRVKTSNDFELDCWISDEKTCLISVTTLSQMNNPHDFFFVVIQVWWFCLFWSEKVSAVGFCLGSGLFGSCNSD